MKTRPAITERPADPHRYPPGIAYADGAYRRMEDAKVSVLDYGFLHSDATYDTVHVWRGAFFRLDLHIERFFASMARLRMTIPYGPAEIAAILDNCVALSGHRDAYVEMLCTRGTSPTFSRDPRDAENRFMAFAVPFGSVASPEQMRRGLSVAVTDTVRIPPASLDPAIKNYHWLDLVNGLYAAYDRGAETALLLDARGDIAEGPGFNVFAVKDGALATPATGVLPGITRRTVMDLCAEEGIPCAPRPVTPAELRTADEVFVTSTAGGIMPVTTLDGAPVGRGRPGPLTTRLHDLYWVRHETGDWITPVEYP